MGIKRKTPLSEEEARFLRDLVAENQNAIKWSVLKSLDKSHEYLYEDTISDLYVLMCEKIDDLKVHPHPEKWIFVAARLTAMRSLQKSKNHSAVLPLDEVPEPRDKQDLFEDVVYEIWLENNVPEKLLSQLTKREREIYYKIYIEKKKPKDIAQELNVSVNNIRNIHKNIRDKINFSVKEKNF